MKEYLNGELIARDTHRHKYRGYGKERKYLRDRAERYHDCTRKISYPSKRDALAAVEMIQSGEENNSPMDAYLCDECGNYHIGHVPVRYLATIKRYFGKEGAARHAAERVREDRYAEPRRMDESPQPDMGGVDSHSG